MASRTGEGLVAEVRTSRGMPSSTLQGVAVVAAVGVVTGALAAWAYYTASLNQLAHVLSPWILLAAVVSARRPPRQAAVSSTAALLGAVVAFYVGKDVMYAIEYPGMPYSVSVDRLVFWCVLAVVAGVALGVGFHRIGGEGWLAAASTAAALGLITGDVVRRVRWALNGDEPLLVFFVIAIVAVLLLAARSGAQWLRTAVLTVPAIAVGLAVAAAPDVLEQGIFIGF